MDIVETVIEKVRAIPSGHPGDSAVDEALDDLQDFLDGWRNTLRLEAFGEAADAILSDPRPYGDPAKYYADKVRGCPDHSDPCDPEDHGIEPPTVDGRAI